MWRRVLRFLVPPVLLVVLWLLDRIGLGTFADTAIVVCLVSLIVGEVISAQSGGQQLAPISSAALSALALAPILPGSQLVPVSAALLVGTVGLIAGQSVRPAMGWGIDPLSAAARWVGLVAAISLGRAPLDGAGLAAFAADRNGGTLAAALVLLSVSLLACVAESLTYWIVRRRSLVGPLDALLSGNFGQMWSLISGMPFVMAFIALGAPSLGWWSLLIFQWPIWLALVGIRRYSKVRQAVRETVDALSRVTDVTGHTRAGHAQEVAHVSVLVGREMGLQRSQLTALERAGLLHDLGQVVLRTPLPGGATVEAAPADQNLIAETGVDIVAQAGGFEDVLPILDHQTAPYRLVREQGEDIPLESRILKAVNAYVDLTEGALSARAHHAALERVSLGLGYEYDPAVVEALARVAEPQESAVRHD